MVSLGGGVVGDTAGYVAATFMRGVAFVQVNSRASLSSFLISPSLIHTHTHTRTHTHTDMFF